MQFWPCISSSNGTFDEHFQHFANKTLRKHSTAPTNLATQFRYCTSFASDIIEGYFMFFRNKYIFNIDMTYINLNVTNTNSGSQFINYVKQLYYEYGAKSMLSTNLGFDK